MCLTLDGVDLVAVAHERRQVGRRDGRVQLERHAGREQSVVALDVLVRRQLSEDEPALVLVGLGLSREEEGGRGRA